jgi:hypothetical protein
LPSCGQLEWTEAYGDVVRRDEAARRAALVDQDRDRVAAGIRLREIEPAIAIEVRSDEAPRARIRADVLARERQRLRRRAAGGDRNEQRGGVNGPASRHGFS